MFGHQSFLRKLVTIFLVLSVCDGGPISKSDLIIFRDDSGEKVEIVQETSKSGITAKVEEVKNFEPSAAKQSTNDDETYINDIKSENGKFFQGDMILQKDQEELFFSNKTNILSRTGLLHERYRWPMYSDGNVYVPYKIADRHFSKLCSLPIWFSS
jgi:hypothetical protein